MTIENNRITSPLTAANAAEDERLAPIPQSSTGIAVVGQVALRIAIVAKALAIALGGLFTVFIPAPWAIAGAAFCTTVYGIADIFVGSGPGVRTNVPPASAVTPVLPPRPSA
jgi:hypothetical protein